MAIPTTATNTTRGLLLNLIRSGVLDELFKKTIMEELERARRNGGWQPSN